MMLVPLLLCAWALPLMFPCPEEKPRLPRLVFKDGKFWYSCKRAERL
jgi:hypothetical protein